MDKILITGGTGIFGLNFAIRKNRNYKIYLIQNKKKLVLLKNIPNVFLLNKKIDNKKKIRKILHQLKPKYVIHAAAITDLEFCENNRKKSKIVNFHLTKNISDECKKINCKLIFLSSDQLFDGKKDYYNENSKTNPLNFYSELKIRSENYIKKSMKNFLIIRTNFFGWGPNYRTSFSDNVIFNLKKEVKINILEDVYFNPISLKYLCESIDKLIKMNKKGVFNISSSKKISKYNLAVKIANTFKLNKDFIKKISLNKLSSEVLRPNNMSLNNNRLLKIYKVPTIDNQIKNLFKEYKNKYYLKFFKLK